jgi:uncharacterized repeat protein (TIGR01451 family)
VETTIPELVPGTSRTLPINVRIRQAGRLQFKVSATGEGGLSAAAQHAIQAQTAALTLQLKGPAVRYVGRSATWDLELTNNGDAPLSQVEVVDRLPAELDFVSATEGGQLQGREVHWTVGNLQPREQKRLQVTTNAARIAERTTNDAFARGQLAGAGTAPVQTTAQATLAVRGLPAFKLQVSDKKDPVEVGGQTAYTIDVFNQGTLPGQQVTVTAVLPAQVRLLRVQAPARYRVEGQRIIFAPLDGLASGQSLSYVLEVEAIQPGEARFHAELTATSLREPVVKEESTNVVK